MTQGKVIQRQRKELLATDEHRFYKKIALVVIRYSIVCHCDPREM